MRAVKREPNVFDEWVEEPFPVSVVADRPRADVHERQRTEEKRDLDQRIRHRDRHAEHRAVAAAVACPRRQQLGRQQDEAEDQEDQRRHRRDDQDLAELRRGDDEHDVEPLGAAQRAGGRWIRHRLERCAGQSICWSSAGWSATSIGLTRSRVTDTTNTAAMSVRNSSASHKRGREIVAAMSHTGELKKTRIVSNSSGSARRQHRSRCGEVRRRHLSCPAQDRTGAARGQRQDGGDEDGLYDEVHQNPWARAAEDAADDRDCHRHRRRGSAADNRRNARHRPADQHRNGQHEDEQRQYEPFRSSRLAVDVDGVFAGEGHRRARSWP